MDQSYFSEFLFRLARKSKQSGLSKSEKSLAKRNGNLNLSQAGSYACRVFLVHVFLLALMIPLICSLTMQ